MKQLLNTMYVTNPDSFIRRDGTNLVVEIAGKEAGRIPIHNLEQVICFGYSGASTGAMHLCVESSVALTFLKPNGRMIATVQGETRGNVLLRRGQYRIADEELSSLAISRNMIEGKMINCRTVLKKGLSNHPDVQGADKLSSSIDKLTTIIDNIQSVGSSAELRGIEGDAARTYFSALDSLILKDKTSFYMHERSRRPPKDRFNSLISFLYSILTNDVRSALDAVGLDPYVGFLHTDRPGRASLALDLMEELRPLADRIALKLINLGMVTSEGFIEEGGGAFMMDDQMRSTVISEWQKAKSQEVYHPFLKQKVQAGLLPHVQSMLLARCIRGDLEGYPPFIIRQAKR